MILYESFRLGNDHDYDDDNKAKLSVKSRIRTLLAQNTVFPDTEDGQEMVIQFIRDYFPADSLPLQTIAVGWNKTWSISSESLLFRSAPSIRLQLYPPWESSRKVQGHYIEALFATPTNLPVCGRLIILWLLCILFFCLCFEFCHLSSRSVSWPGSSSDALESFLEII